MNNLSNVTKERLEEMSEDGFLEHGESKAIARELLARRMAADINPCIGYISKNAVMRMVEGKSRFCSLYPEPEREYKIAVYLDRPFIAPPLHVVPDLKKLALEIVENLVDCGAADDAAMKQYLKWTEKTIRAAMLKHQPQNAQQNIPKNIPAGNSPTTPDGWALVPIEITDDIAEAIAKEASCCGGIAFDIYQAILAAAPKPGGNNA